MGRVVPPRRTGIIPTASFNLLNTLVLEVVGTYSSWLASDALRLS